MAERPRVLVCITSLDGGGAQRHVRDLLAALRGRFTFHVAGGSPGWLAREVERLGARVHPLALQARIEPAGDLRARRELQSLLTAVRPELLHVHSTKAAFLGRLAARSAGVPVVYTVHGWPFQTGLRGREAVLSLAAEHLLGDVARRVIAVSRRDAEVALERRIVRSERLRVIENGIDTADYAWHPGPYGRRFLYLGRLEPGKGLDRLLQALGGLRSLDWALTVCGSGSLQPSLEAAAQARAISDRVRFAGWQDDPRPFFAEADCLVLPSDKEGLPYAVLEAVACGLSLVVTAVGGLAALDLRQAARIPPRDGPALQAALRAFLESGWRDAERLPRREEVAALMEDRFNLARMADGVAAVYGEVLDGR